MEIKKAIDDAAMAIKKHADDTPSSFSTAYMNMVLKGAEDALGKSSHWRKAIRRGEFKWNKF